MYKNNVDIKSSPSWKSLEDEPGVQDTNCYAGQERLEIDNMFIREPKRLLDIGCSTGSVGKRLKNKYPGLFAWGVEISSAANEANTCLDKVSTYLVSDFEDSEMQLLSSIDTVLLLDVLEHMYDPWKTLGFISNAIPHSAQVIVSLPNTANLNILRDLANGFWHYQETGLLDVTHIRFFTLYEMQKMFYETGFRILRTHFSMEYCVDPEKYPPHAYPAWVQYGEIKLIVKNYEHFLSLNSRQIFFTIEPIKNSELSMQERELAYSPHPKTWAY